MTGMIPVKSETFRARNDVPRMTGMIRLPGSRRDSNRYVPRMTGMILPVVCR